MVEPAGLVLDQGSLAGDGDVPDFVAAQRICVRLLFDPAWVERVYADPEGTLAPEGVTPALIRQLVANDRRLWGADRLRRSRALKVLMEEFKVTTALVLAETGRLAALDAFFSSEAFHRAVQERRYMALAFVAFLEEAVRAGRLVAPQLRAVLALEGGMALARRLLREARRGRDPVLAGARPAESGELLARAPGVVAVAAPSGTLEVVQHLERWLFETGLVPALALCEDVPRPEPLPEVDERRPEGWLLEAQPGGKVDLGALPARFRWVVTALDRPRSPGALARFLGLQGIGPETARELADALLEAGVLRRASRV